jgi:hypothetical protein
MMLEDLNGQRTNLFNSSQRVGKTPFTDRLRFSGGILDFLEQRDTPRSSFRNKGADPCKAPYPISWSKP